MVEKDIQFSPLSDNLNGAVFKVFHCARNAALLSEAAGKNTKANPLHSSCYSNHPLFFHQQINSLLRTAFLKALPRKMATRSQKARRGKQRMPLKRR